MIWFRSQLLQNNSHDLRCLEKQSRIARGNDELLRQIREKEDTKKEEKARAYYDDMKMIEAGNVENKVGGTTGNCHSNSLMGELDELIQIKNEAKEKTLKKIKDDEIRVSGGVTLILYKTYACLG